LQAVAESAVKAHHTALSMTQNIYDNHDFFQEYMNATIVPDVQLREAKDSRRLDRPCCARYSGAISCLVDAACLRSLAGCWHLDLAVSSGEE
jgi:hypothetical protein